MTNKPAPTLSDPWFKNVKSKEVAAFTAEGLSMREIADKAQLSIAQVRRIRDMPEFKDELAKVQEETLGLVKTRIKQRLAHLDGEVHRVIKAQLKKDNLEAVRITLRTLGLEDKQVETKQNTNIQVVMPNMKDDDDDDGTIIQTQEE